MNLDPMYVRLHIVVPQIGLAAKVRHSLHILISMVDIKFGRR